MTDGKPDIAPPEGQEDQEQAAAEEMSVSVQDCLGLCIQTLKAPVHLEGTTARVLAATTLLKWHMHQEMMQLAAGGGTPGKIVVPGGPRAVT